jgi:hypothetical protein
MLCPLDTFIGLISIKGATNQRWIFELVKATGDDVSQQSDDSWQLAHKTIDPGTYYIRNRVKNSQWALWFLSDQSYAPIVVWPAITIAGPERKVMIFQFLRSRNLLIVSFMGSSRSAPTKPLAVF